MIPLDRLKGALGTFVASVMARVDYFALYECTVVQQNGDGSLELAPIVQGKIAGQSHIPIRYGDPGTAIQVSPGTTVLLGWRDGDPKAPYAALWAPGGASGLRTMQVAASQSLSFQAPRVALGQGSQPELLSTPYRAAEDAAMMALQTALTAIAAFGTALASGTPGLVAGGTLAGAITPTIPLVAAFPAGKAAYLSGTVFNS